MMKVLIPFLFATLLMVSSCAETPTTTVVSFPSIESCKNIKGGEVVLVRMIFMGESGNSADFLPDRFSIAAFTMQGSLIGEFSRLDSILEPSGNPLLIGPKETTTPVYDVFYFAPEVSSPTTIYFDTRPFVVSNLDAFDCLINP